MLEISEIIISNVLSGVLLVETIQRGTMNGIKFATVKELIAALAFIAKPTKSIFRPLLGSPLPVRSYTSHKTMARTTAVIRQVVSSTTDWCTRELLFPRCEFPIT